MLDVTREALSSKGFKGPNNDSDKSGLLGVEFLMLVFLKLLSELQAIVRAEGPGTMRRIGSLLLS